MFVSNSQTKRRRRMIAWASSLTAISVVQAAFAARNIQVDRVAHGTATFATNGSLTTITASNHAVINYKQFNIANGQTVRFVQPGAAAKVLNRITSNAPSMLNGTLLANGIVYFVNPAGVMFGPHSIINVSGIIAAAGNITDNDFAGDVDHFSGTGALVNSGVINANSAQLVGQSVTNHGTINAPGGIVAMVAGQDVMLGSNSSQILVKIGTTNGNGGVTNTGTINATGGQASLVSGDLYSMAMGTPSVIKASQVNVQGGTVAISGKIDASNVNGNGGNVTVTGGTIALNSATINASGSTGGGTIKVGGDFHAASDLPLAKTTSVSSDSTLTADATANGAGGQVAIWSSVMTSFAGTISARGAGTGTGGFAEISSKGTLSYPGIAYVGGPGGAGSVLLDPATFTIAPSGGDETGAALANQVITGGNLIITASNLINVHDTVDISSTTNTLTLDAPVIDFTAPVIVHSGTPNLLGSSAVSTVNIHNGALIQNGIEVFSGQMNATPAVVFPLIVVDPGTYAEDVNVNLGTSSFPVTLTIVTSGAGTVTMNSMTVSENSLTYLNGSFTATNGFTFNELVSAGLPTSFPTVPSQPAESPQDLLLTGPLTINNDGGGTSDGNLDVNNQNVTVVTDSLSISSSALVDNITGTSGQGTFTLQPATAGDTIGIGDVTPPAATLQIDPMDNLGANMRLVTIGSPTGTGAITIGSASAQATFQSPVTIQSPGTGGSITVNGQINGPLNSFGALTLTAPTVAINAPIAMTSFPNVTVAINGATTLSSNITTIGGNITITGDVTLGADSTIDTTSGLNLSPLLIGNIVISFVSNGNGHSLTLNSGKTGTISVNGNVDNVANLNITQSDGATFAGTVGAGTAGNVSVNGTQSGATITFDGAANILTLTTDGATLGYTVAFNQTTGGQTSTIQTASLSNTSGINLGNDTTDSITFTNGLNYQVGSTTAIGSVSTNGTTNIDLAQTTLSGNTTFTAGTTTFHNSITGNVALTVDGNAAFDGSLPTFTSLHVTGTTLLTPASVTTTGTQTYDGLVTLSAGAAESFSGSSLAFSGGLTGDGNNVTVSNNATFGAVGSITHLQINANATFTDTVGVNSLTVTGTTGVSSGAITTSGAQDYQGAVTLNGNGQFISTGSGNITFESTIDSFSSANSLFTETSGVTTFDGNIGSIHPISGMQTAPFGSVQLGAGGANSTISITSTTSPDGEVLFNFPVTLAADTTITAGNVIFSGSLDSDSDLTPRNLTITAVAGTLDFAGPFTAQSLTAAAADVSFGPVGQTHSLGAVMINASTSSASAVVDLNDVNMNVSTATFTSPVTLTADVTLTSTGDVTFDSTVDSDAQITPRALTINTPGTTTFDGAVGGTNLLSQFTSSSTGTTAINTPQFATSGTQNFNNPVTLGADTTLTGSTVTFSNTIAGAHALAVDGAGVFDQTVNIGSLVVSGNTTIATTSIATTSDQLYIGAASITTASPVTFTAAATTFDSSLTGGSNSITFDGDATLHGVSNVADIQVNGSANFDGNVSAIGITVTGSTTIDAAQISTLGAQHYDGPLTLASDTILTNTSNLLGGGGITLGSTVDSDSNATPRGLEINSAGPLVIDGDIGDNHPLANLTVDSGGTTQLGAGVANSTIAITTVTNLPNGAVTFNNPVTLAANTTITARTVDFANTLDSDADATPRDLTITAAPGILEFTGSFSAESLTGGGANVTFGSTGQTHELGNVVINASSVSPSSTVDLNGGAYSFTSATFTSPVILTADTSITATGNVTFDSTIDSDANATERLLTINTPGTTTFAGDVGDTHPLSSLTMMGGGFTDLNAASITVAGTQTFTDTGVSLGANVTLRGGTVDFLTTLTGNSHNLTVSASTTEFLAAVTQLGTLNVANNVTIGANISSTGSQTYGAATLTSAANLTGNGLTFGSIAGGANNLTLDAGSGNISITGSLDNVALLTIANSTGATFVGAIGQTAPGAITITNTTGTVAFQGNTHITTLTTGANGFAVAFTGGTTRVDNATTFNNTGGITLGNNSTDTITFTNGLTYTAGTTLLGGTLTASNAPILLGTMNVQETSTIDAGSGAITLGATTIAASDALNLGAGHSGDITVASLAGNSTSAVTVNATGDFSVTGTVGSAASPLGSLTVTAHDSTFGDAITTAGDITVTGVEANTENAASDADLVFHGNLSSGGNITLNPGTDIFSIGNIADALAPATITFYGNSITAAGNVSLVTNTETRPGVIGSIFPSVANIIALGSPSNVASYGPIALNIQANSLTMGPDANMVIATGGVDVTLGNGSSTFSSISALGSIIINADPSATLSLVNRVNWNALTYKGTLIPTDGSLFFAGGTGQLSTPANLPTVGLTKFARVFDTTNAKEGTHIRLPNARLLTSTTNVFSADGLRYYLLVPARLPRNAPVSTTQVPLGGLNLELVQENIIFDSAMRKEFTRFGLYGRDATLDIVDSGVLRLPAAHELLVDNDVPTVPPPANNP